MEKRSLRDSLITALLVAVLIAAVLFFVFAPSKNSEKKAAESIRNTILDRAMQCYVIEGAYPEDLKYLKDNYGLAVNEEEYRIVYIAYAGNIPPEIKVVPRKER